MAETRPSNTVAKGGLAGVGIAILAVVCCGAIPLLAATFSALALGALLGIAGGVVGVAALMAVVVVRAGRRRACALPSGNSPDSSARPARARDRAL
jgi:hypothetical protein